MVEKSSLFSKIKQKKNEKICRLLRIDIKCLKRPFQNLKIPKRSEDCVAFIRLRLSLRFENDAVTSQQS